jgi:hypothetical protein
MNNQMNPLRENSVDPNPKTNPTLPAPLDQQTQHGGCPSDHAVDVEHARTRPEMAGLVWTLYSNA